MVAVLQLLRKADESASIRKTLHCSFASVCTEIKQTTTACSEGQLVSSPQQTRRGQRQLLMQLLHNPQTEFPEHKGKHLSGNLDASAVYMAKVKAPPLVLPQQEQTALSKANRVLENPTIATQLVIGCYAAMHKTNGVGRICARCMPTTKDDN